MRAHSSTRFAAMVILVGGLACAGNKARTADGDQAAAARDTSRDSVTGEAQNPPGYRGMERDTTIAPQAQQPSDTFLQNQGQGQPQDTAGYSGMERSDTTGAAAGARDTTGAFGADTTGANQGGLDTTSAGQTGMDTTGQSRDTTGYDPSQQPSQDTTSAR
jgi:hypothetical protein